MQVENIVNLAECNLQCYYLSSVALFSSIPQLPFLALLYTPKGAVACCQRHSKL